MRALLSSLNSAHGVGSRLESIIEVAVAQLQDGQPIDVEAFATAHSEYASELRELLPTMAMMVRLGETGPESAGLPLSPSPSPREGESNLPQQQLGDFRILRELGRGGMGVVYEAEQLSLGRRVALKVLPFAAMLDRQQLVRFKNEALAAATLDHPHIVAIYSVGCERSVHYYAMQLIEGRSIAEIIAELRTGRTPSAGEAAATAACSKRATAADTAKAAVPTVRATGSAAVLTIPPFKSRDFYRSVARLGIQAAEALDHAHQNGILHRDIKPANLLVDDSGKLWITDFGLARIEADAGMTMTGDVLGTLRYMSPEQATADRALIDHRCDIYALGATLYELLTLQPAFADTDRAKLLQHIALQEPQRPRKIDEHIPVDLETIALKAMAKQREERYQTAEQFQGDLRAFLDSRPIKARAPGLLHRAAKWSRRHQRLVSTAAVGFVLLSAILAVSMVRVQVAKTQAIDALEETADLLYTSDMALAYQTFEKGWSDESQTILDRHRPIGGESDRRGFEWQLLQKLVRQPSAKALAAHQGPVNELAVFPGQRQLASVGNDGTLRLWDIATGKLERTISICDEELHSVAISPDGQYVAVGSTVVYLCNLAQGNQTTELFRSDFTVESLAFSADGKHIALGTRYDEVCLITSGGQVEKRLICMSRNESLEFVPGSGLLLLPNRRMTANQKKLGIAQLWREDLSRMEREFDATRDDVLGNITVARSSPCGNFVVAGEERNSGAQLFDIHSSRVVAATPVSRDWLMDLAYSPDGRSIAVAYRNGQVEIFSISPADDGKPLISGRPRVLRAHQGEVTGVRFIDAKTVATCGADGMIQIWNLSTDAAAKFDLGDVQIRAVALSPDGHLLLCVGISEFFIVDVESGKIVFRRNAETYFDLGEWSPSGDRAAVFSTAGESVFVFDPTGRSICEISHDGPIGAFAFSPSGSTVAVVGEKYLQIASSTDGRTVNRRPLGVPCREVCYSHDESRIACGGEGGRIHLFDATTLQAVYELECASAVYCLAFSPDDSILASGHRDSTIRTWEIETGRIRAELVGHEQAVLCVAYSPDGRTLLSTGSDGAARLWSLDHNRAFGAFHRRPSKDVLTGKCRLSLSSDGRYLALGYEFADAGTPDILLWKLRPSAND